MDQELKKRFIAGKNVTATDMICLFEMQFIFERDLYSGRGGGSEQVEKWVKECETESWKRAVEKTGYGL